MQHKELHTKPVRGHPPVILTAQQQGAQAEYSTPGQGPASGPPSRRGAPAIPYVEPSVTEPAVLISTAAVESTEQMGGNKRRRSKSLNQSPADDSAAPLADTPKHFNVPMADEDSQMADAGVTLTLRIFFSVSPRLS